MTGCNNTARQGPGLRCRFVKWLGSDPNCAGAELLTPTQSIARGLLKILLSVTDTFDQVSKDPDNFEERYGRESRFN